MSVSNVQTAEELRLISRQIRAWLDWHKQSREKDGLETTDDTSIMALPVPSWPSHGQFERWIEALDMAAVKLEEGL